MAVARASADDELTATRREAAKWRTRARDAEEAAADAEQHLDTILGLIADKVIDGLRDRGWVEFHRDRPTHTAPPTPNPDGTPSTPTEGNIP